MTLLNIVRTSDCTPEGLAEMKKMLMEQISINIDQRLALAEKNSDQQELIDGLKFQMKQLETLMVGQEKTFNDLRSDLQKFCKITERSKLPSIIEHRAAVMDKLGKFILANGQQVSGVNA